MTRTDSSALSFVTARVAGSRKQEAETVRKKTLPFPNYILSIRRAREGHDGETILHVHHFAFTGLALVHTQHLSGVGVDEGLSDREHDVNDRQPGCRTPSPY